MNKTIVEKHFDKVADNYDSGKGKYSFYYCSLKKLLASLIPPNMNVLEIGCGTGDLLASLKPKYGYGMDISSKMINIAKEKYKNNKNLVFSTKFPILKSSIINHHSFDYIFMSDVIEHLENPEQEFKKVAKLMTDKSVFINTMANPIWEPMLMFWEIMGWKMKEGKHKRISYNEIRSTLESLGLKVVTHGYKLLIPIEIPILTNYANKYLEKPLKKFAFIEFFEASRH